MTNPDLVDFHEAGAGFQGSAQSVPWNAHARPRTPRAI